MARRTSSVAATPRSEPVPRVTLVAPPASPAADTSLVAPDGARAELRDGVLALVDAEGRLLLRYREGALEIGPASGDLVLAAPGGQVRIAAATDVVVEAARDLALGGKRGCTLRAGVETSDADGKAAPLQVSQLALDPRAARLTASALDVRARTSSLAVGEATVLARRIQTTATKIATTAEDLELTAGRVVERARELTQEVTEAWSGRFGRVRAIVRGVYAMRSQRTELRSKDDTAIDGRRVLLG